MARKSSKEREKTFLRKCRSKSTADLEQQYENIQNTEGPLSNKIARRIKLIETVLRERGDSRIKIRKVVENDRGAVMPD
jgi:hypothetical protein